MSLQPRVLGELRSIVGPDGVLHEPEDLIVYEYDAYLDRALPQVVVRPASAEQVVGVVRLAAREGLAVTPRGGASGLSGGAIPIEGGIMVDCNRMHRILRVDLDNRAALVEPGLINLDLSTAVAPLGWYYAPDPSSQKVSTIGGNIAENAGGPHCLSRGMTTNHILGLELVARDGELIEIGGPAPDAPGCDLTGLVVGSEGTFGIVTKAWVRLLPLPPDTVTFLALFETVDAAGAAVSAIIANGVIPSALELIDGPTAAALERAFRAGYPPGAGAVLLIEADGLPEVVAEEAAIIARLCESAPGALGLRRAETPAERARAFSARVRDLSELLAELPPDPPGGRLQARVTYQDACHLAHAQRIREQPRQVLRAIPGLELTEMADADRCCGSAGIYNLTEPELARTFGEQKVGNIIATAADLVVSANPGCLIQIRAGLQERGSKTRAVHLADLLDAAYRVEARGSYMSS